MPNERETQISRLIALDLRIAEERGRLLGLLPVSELRNILKLVTDLRVEREEVCSALAVK